SPEEDQSAALAAMAAEGVEHTVSLETIGMADSTQAEPTQVSIKVVDPFRYPFYGAVELDPPQPLTVALQPDSVVVSRLTAERLAIRVGDSVRMNGARFRVTGLLTSEP